MCIANSIKEIEISGFKSIKNQIIDLKNLNVFIGANGSGKTNLMSFFKMLQFYMSSDSGLDEFVGRSGGAEYLLHFGTKHTDTIRARLVFAAQKGENEYIVELGISAADALYFKDEKVSFSDRMRPETKGRQHHLASGMKTSRLRQINKDDPDFGTHFATIATSRTLIQKMRFYQFHDTTPDAHIRKLTPTDDNTYLRSDGGNLGAFLHMLRENYPGNFADLIDVFKQIAPYVSDIALDKEYGASSIRLGWREHDSPEYRFCASQMSDGTLRMLALVCLFMQPNPPSIMCVDEPELGLHPVAIAVLADLMVAASQKSQIIVATQSTALVDHFEPDDIVVTNKVRGVTAFERLEYEKYKAWLDEYAISDVWETNVFGGRPQR